MYLRVLCVSMGRFSCTITKVATVVSLTWLPHSWWLILSVYVSLALCGSPSKAQRSPSAASTAILPPKYGPVATSISLAWGRHCVALAETAKRRKCVAFVNLYIHYIHLRVSVGRNLRVMYVLINKFLSSFIVYTIMYCNIALNVNGIWIHNVYINI